MIYWNRAIVISNLSDPDLTRWIPGSCSQRRLLDDQALGKSVDQVILTT